MKQDEVDATKVTRETYDQIASGYAQRINDLVSDTWVGRFEKSLLDKLVTSVMMRGGRTAEILDIGCGYGKDTFYLSQKKESLPLDRITLLECCLRRERTSQASVSFRWI